MRLLPSALCMLAFSSTVLAADLTATMTVVSGPNSGQTIGTVKFENNHAGVLVIPNLHGLTPGIHGLHVHVTPACGDEGKAAGPHLDPAKTDAHNGPYVQKSHLGDLPALTVDEQGNATLVTLAPHLKLAELKDHALMIHVGGDNYSDQPEKLGGGGARLACGVIE